MDRVVRGPVVNELLPFRTLPSSVSQSVLLFYQHLSKFKHPRLNLNTAVSLELVPLPLSRTRENVVILGFYIYRRLERLGNSALN